LDALVFNEDQSHLRKNNAGKNMGLKNLWKKAGWDNQIIDLMFKQAF
jgi:hypothetical protein